MPPTHYPASDEAFNLYKLTHFVTLPSTALTCLHIELATSDPSQLTMDDLTANKLIVNHPLTRLNITEDCLTG